MGLHPVNLGAEPDPCGDDGWEAVEEERLQRRSSRRRIRATPSCGLDSRPRRREPDTIARRLFGGVGYRGMGAGLLAILLLVLAASYLDGRRENAPSHLTVRPAAASDHDPFADHDRDYAYAYADYARRYDVGSAWSRERFEPEVSPWFGESRGWIAGGLLVVLIGMVVGVALSRTSPADPSDD